MRRWDEDQDWEADEVEDSDGDDTVPCPHCKRPIYEGSERCPHCESYISEEDAPPARKPWWIIVGALLVLLIVYFWIRHGG